MRVNGQVIRWNEVGHGAFNKTFVSVDKFNYEVNGVNYYQHWVLKKPMALKNEELPQKMNATSRAVRVWNIINPNYPAVALPKENGWLVPFLGEEESNDAEVEVKQVEIYRSSRRIIADACGYKNFLFFDDDSVCIDVDLATHKDSPTSKRILSELVELGAENSVYEEYWQEYQTKYKMPKSVQMTKTLLYLDSQVPAEKICDHHITIKVMRQLHVYQREGLPITDALLDQLSLSTQKSTMPHYAELLSSDAAFFKSQVYKSQKVQSSIVGDIGTSVVEAMCVIS